MSPRLLPVAGTIVVIGLLAWGSAEVLERLLAPPAEPLALPANEPVVETAHIQVTLFYGAADGSALIALRRDVDLAADPMAQARIILGVQLQPAPAPYVSVIPAGTTLRAFYLTPSGDAFIDLSAEASRAHPGGSLFEFLTVQAIVHSVTANLPTVKRVQILVDGKEVETLAGHIDLQRPMSPDPSVVRE